MTGPWWRTLVILAAFQLSVPAFASERGTWVSDPARPESSNPPAGRSLFDHLFSQTDDGKSHYVIPYPFADLVERLEQQLPDASTAPGGIQQVLIPMGRSLVRNASRPGYFSSPRLVLAVDASPRFNTRHAGLLLKDRLYIGYMEKFHLLEVISYNEAAGRFEFQLVENYGPGMQPKVSYPNRQLCVACHQNAAPIFSRQQWDETNANPAIDALLEQQDATRYGVPTGAGVDIPFAIDSATDRANYYSYYQLMWRDGCQSPGGSADKARQSAVYCRAALLRAVLQFLLTDGAGFDTDSVLYQMHFRKFVQANAAQRWPEGLLIADPDIPNRNPVLNYTGRVATDGADLPNVNVIGEAFDPLVPRAALKRLDAGSDSALHLLVSGLAGFLAETDGRRLDQYLFETAIRKNLVKHQELSCSLQEKVWSGQGRRWGFDCRAAAGAAPGPVTSLRGRFTLERDKVSQAAVRRMVLVDGSALRNLALRQLPDEAGSRMMRFRLFNGSLHARLHDGNAIGGLSLAWPVTGSGSITVTAQLSILEDFDLLDEALRNLLQQVENNQADGLSDLPFRRASILPSLFDALGMQQLDWCCTGRIALPEANDGTPVHSKITGLRPFFQYCATCHAAQSVFPANFLYGDEKEVRQRISHCAERIFYRLSMARKAPGQRGKSPMPPLLALEVMGQEHSAWLESAALEALLDYTGELLQQQGRGEPDIQQYERRGFDRLRSCLATDKYE